MYIGEKSDKVIVLKKTSNNEILISAEVLEGSALPKRNVGQTTTFRTLSRVAVSRVVADVRRRAKAVILSFTFLLVAFLRLYLREEPSALVAPAGICAGGAGQLAFLPRPLARE